MIFERSRASAAVGQGKGPGTYKGSILAVEDEEIQREFLEIALEENGYKVILAADGLEAVKIYSNRKKEIDVVLLDMGLPKMKGEKVLSEIVGTNPGAKVIAVTGSVDREVLAGILRNGAVDYLLKPYLTDELLLKVNHVLHGRRP